MEPNAAAPAPSMGVLSRIINLIVSPTKTFEALIAKPDWVTPVIIFLVFSIATSILLKNVIQTEAVSNMRESIMKSDRVPEGQKEQIIEQQTGFIKSLWFVFFFVGVAVIIGAYFLSALFLKIGGNKMFGGGPTYMQVASIFFYSTLIDAVSALVKVPLMYVNQTMRVDTGLGILMGESETHSNLYKLLAKFDLFTFWQLAVLVIGMSLLYKASKGKTAALVVGLWLAWILAVAGLGAAGIKIGG